MSSGLLTSLGLGGAAGGSGATGAGTGIPSSVPGSINWGAILGHTIEGAGKIRSLMQRSEADKAELRQLSANQELLTQQAQARAEDLTLQRAQQESQNRALLAATYGPDFGRSGTSAAAFQREGDRLFQQDLARNQSNLAAQSAGIQAQKSAVKAGTPGMLDYAMAVGGAGAGILKNFRKPPSTATRTTVHPTLVPPVTPTSRGKPKGVMKFGANWGQPGYGKAWWDL